MDFGETPRRRRHYGWPALALLVVLIGAALFWQERSSWEARTVPLRDITDSSIASFRKPGGLDAVFSSDGHYLATRGGMAESPNLALWELKAPRIVHRLESRKLPGGNARPAREAPGETTFVFSRDGRRLAWYVNNRVLVFEVQSGVVRGDFAETITDSVALAFSNDGACIGSVADGRRVTVWDIAKGNIVLQRKFPTRLGPDGKTVGDARALAFSPTRRLLAVLRAAVPGEVVTVDGETSLGDGTLPAGNIASPGTAAPSASAAPKRSAAAKGEADPKDKAADQSRAVENATGPGGLPLDSVVQYFEIPGGREMAKHPLPFYASGMAFAPNGRRLAVAGKDLRFRENIVELRAVNNGAQEGHTEIALNEPRLFFNPEGTLLAAAPRRLVPMLVAASAPPPPGTKATGRSAATAKKAPAAAPRPAHAPSSAPALVPAAAPDYSSVEPCQIWRCPSLRPLETVTPTTTPQGKTDPGVLLLRGDEIAGFTDDRTFATVRADGTMRLLRVE